MKGTNKRIQAVDLDIKDQNGQTLLDTNVVGLILASGAAMPVESALADLTHKRVYVNLRNGERKTLRPWTKIEVVVGKAKVSNETPKVSGKTLSDKKKAEKSARDRAIRQAMKQPKGSKPQLTTKR